MATRHHRCRGRAELIDRAFRDITIDSAPNHTRYPLQIAGSDAMAVMAHRQHQLVQHDGFYGNLTRHGGSVSGVQAL